MQFGCHFRFPSNVYHIRLDTNNLILDWYLDYLYMYLSRALSPFSSTVNRYTVLALSITKKARLFRYNRILVSMYLPKSHVLLITKEDNRVCTDTWYCI